MTTTKMMMMRSASLGIAFLLVSAVVVGSSASFVVIPTSSSSSSSASCRKSFVITRIGVAFERNKNNNDDLSNETDSSTMTYIWNSVQMKKRILQQPFFRMSQEEQMSQSIKLEQQREEMKRLQQEITNLQNELWTLKAQGGQDLWKQKYMELQTTQKTIQNQHLNAMEARTLRLEALENQLKELSEEYNTSQNELQTSMREQKRLEKLLLEKDQQHQEEITVLTTLQEQTLKKTIENERSKAAKELEKLKKEFLEQLEQLQETSRVELGIAETEFELALREMKLEREAAQEKHYKAVSDWASALENSNRRIENLEEMLRSTNDKFDETMAAYVSARKELESTQSTLDVTVQQLDETSTLLMQATEEIELLTNTLKTTAQKLDDTELVVRILEGEKKSMRHLFVNSFRLIKDRIKSIPKRFLERRRRRRNDAMETARSREFPSLRPAYQKLERAKERLRHSNLPDMKAGGGGREETNSINKGAIFFAGRDSSRQQGGQQ